MSNDFICGLNCIREKKNVFRGDVKWLLALTVSLANSF
jgi:hypothetical protein